ncbi:MAG TPA: carbamoyltransferase C-terminal domain-containing protein [Methylomirabilota bacterium]|jgi:carbamoyltransferase|nr:carbamoyltransferase C-terminal domain-containing protein [Methylomirabilota bacterium]
MKILGINFTSDASAALVVDGVLVAGISEERLNRIKRWYGIPHWAIQAVLDQAGLTLDDIDLIATHGAHDARPDEAAFDAKEALVAAADLPDDIRQVQLRQLHVRREHERNVLAHRTPGYVAAVQALGRPVRMFGHHTAHAAGAYYGSGWDECIVLTADGWGDEASATLWDARDGHLTRVALTPTIDSLGYFYGSITKALGFTPHRHEGKVLGLAAYCTEPKSYPTIRAMIDYDPRAKRFVSHPEGGLYLPFFDSPNLCDYVRGYPREDVAAAAQRSLEEVVCACVADLGGRDRRIAVAGGIFANVKLNQRIRELPNVAEVYVFPNMGDGGLSVGAAWLAHVAETGMRPERLGPLSLGPAATKTEIADAISRSGLRYSECADMPARVAALLADGHVVARFDGRMEFGPRALGHRSILYRANEPAVNDWLNRRLHRSEFMPFAPATLAEQADARYVGLEGGRDAARYMAMTFDCTPRMREESPAAVHVDGTARPQIVSRADNPGFHAVLQAYHRRSGLPTVINTSFNMHEEPIVCTIDDALRAVSAAGLPYLAAGDFLVHTDAEGRSR